MAKADKVMEQAQTHLAEGESVLGLVHGTCEMGRDSVRKCIVIATETRLVFYARKPGGFELESFPYEMISSVEHSKTTLGHSFSFFTSGHKVSLKWVSTDDDFNSFLAITKAHVADASTQRATPLGEAP
jgi:hypothetical protein